MKEGMTGRIGRRDPDQKKESLSVYCTFREG